MGELINGVSWWAVILGFVVSFLLGWLWYSPKMFGKTWAEGSGVSRDNMSPMAGFAMITQALSTFCLSWIVGITATSDALLTMILIVITILLFITSNGKFAGKSNAAITIEVCYIVVMAVIMFIFQGIF